MEKFSAFAISRILLIFFGIVPEDTATTPSASLFIPIVIYTLTISPDGVREISEIIVLALSDS
jgi:hypothetical protein